MKNNFELLLAKIGRFVGSDRFWVVVLLIAMILLGVPDAVVEDTVTELDPEFSETALLLVKLFGLIGSPAWLINSYTKRKPGGLTPPNPAVELVQNAQEKEAEERGEIVANIALEKMKKHGADV